MADTGKTLGYKLLLAAYAWTSFEQAFALQIKLKTNISPRTLPQYGSKPPKPGLYLGLFHGRDDPKQLMLDWGFYGPTIGPLQYCHTTYTSHIKIRLEEASDGRRYFGILNEEFMLTMADDMIAFDGKYYGDWTLYYVPPDA